MGVTTSCARCGRPVKLLEALLLDLDQAWQLSLTKPVCLRLIGSMALMTQTGYARGTKDMDVLETMALRQEVQQELMRLAAPKTELARRHRLYVDVVRSVLPFMPARPVCHPMAGLAGRLRHFEVEVVDVVDIVVSKLKRFHGDDAGDIEAMVDGGHVSHAALVRRFRLAAERFADDARAEELPRYVRNLHQVERDLFGVDPSEIELPSWT